MIPNKIQATVLWDKYELPQKKRIHVTWVAKVAIWLAQQVTQVANTPIDTSLLMAGALLHDIDKAVPRLPGEKHPDTAVRILTEEGMDEVAQLVRTHPLHAIVDPTISPKSWEEKLLYLADKMVKYDVITVDKRFALWRAEDLPVAAQTQLDEAYPKVKALEQEIFATIGIVPEDVAKIVQ